MALRHGIVVAVHPEDHSVDLVLTHNGARLVGVQVMTPNGSTRSGLADLPRIETKANKWDITTAGDQELIALVDYVEKTPVVMGFLYPQINQMLFADPTLRLMRHQSDVISHIDGKGNMEIRHPSGAYVRIAETPGSTDLAGRNFDGNLKVTRNTNRQVHLRVALAGNAVELTMAPDGTVTMKVRGDMTMEADGEMRLTASAMKFDTQEAHFTGAIVSDGDTVADGVSLIEHQHGNVQGGPGKTSRPVR